MAELAVTSTQAKTALELIKSKLDEIKAKEGVTGATVNGESCTVTDGVIIIDLSEFATLSDVTDKIAEVVANAPEDLDTLKEIADWIENHADDASAMNTQIKANAEDIEELKALLGSLPDGYSTITDYIASVVYEHPTATAYDEGLYNITVDGYGHVIKATNATISDDDFETMLEEVFAE